MDEMDNNKDKKIFGKLKSSINNSFLSELPKVGTTSSFSKSFYDVDIDSFHNESNNHDNSDFKINREHCKLEFQRNLKRKLSDLKSKNQYNDEFSFKPKFRNHNLSLKDDVVTNESFSIPTKNQELDKLKTNYRTLCDFDIKKPVESVLSPQNTLNNSGFLSMSRQSLNDSVNESGISSTASRIAANILNKSNLQKSDILNKTSNNLSSKSFSMRTRRYRTIIKQDKFSSYLTRVPKEDSLFNVPNFGTSNVVLNLNCSEDTAKRVDFSYAHIIQGEHNKNKESIDSNIYWTCINCNSSNPSNFNFCPTCSTSNPKLVLNEKNFKPLTDDNTNVWICSRCSTKNEEYRLVCIFCFKNKNFSSKKPKLDINADEKCLNSKSGFNFTETNSINMNFNFTSENGKTDKLVVNNNLPVKLSCESCLGDSEKCVTCKSISASKSGSFCSATSPNKVETQQSQPSFTFGSSNVCSEKSDIKFGSSAFVQDNLPSAFVFGAPQSESELIKPKMLFGQSDLTNSAANETKSGKKWSCSECWAENEAERNKCACCSATNPNKVETQQSTPRFTFGSSNVCSDKSDIKFGSSAFVQDNLKPAFVFGTSPAKLLFGQPDLTNCPANETKSGKKWSCSECWAENEAERNKCACCGFSNSSKENSQPNKSISSISSDISKPTIKFGSANDECTPREQSIIFGTSNKGTSPAISEKWKCSECWVDNDADKDKCVCCAAKNPSASITTPSIQFGLISSSEAPKSIFSFGIANSVTNEGLKSAKKWNCSDCWAENEAERDKCACCGGRNPSVTANNQFKQQSIKFGSSDSAISVDKAVPSASSFVFKSVDSVQFKFGDKASSGNQATVPTRVALQNGIGRVLQTKWGCPTCLVENEESVESCACCQTKKPNSSSQTNKAPIFEFNKEQSTFKFGCGSDVKTKTIENGCDFPKLESKIDKPVTLRSNLPDSDSQLNFTFSPPDFLPVAASAQFTVPVDLVFEFSPPKFL